MCGKGFNWLKALPLLSPLGHSLVCQLSRQLNGSATPLLLLPLAPCHAPAADRFVSSSSSCGACAGIFMNYEAEQKYM